MLAAERHLRITAAVREHGVVGTDELARLLEVSVETVRRDLIALERSGHVERVHGGATRVHGFPEEAPFAARRDTAVREKQAIGRAAAALVRPGQTIVIDVGTTAVELARALPDSLRITVATCSLLVAAELAGRPTMRVLVSGGQVRDGDLALANAQTVAFFADLRADLAFLGSGGLDVRAGLTDYHVDEVATRRTIIANAARSLVLADSSKLGATAPHRVCALTDVDGVVTGGRVPAALARAITRSGGTVVRAG